MILSEHEVQTCLIYVLKPILKKYDMNIKEAHLSICDQIVVRAQISHQERLFDLMASFDIDYKNNCLCFTNITGKVEYLFLSLNIVSAMQQFLKDEHLTFSKDACFYACKMPIKELQIEEKNLKIILK